jgi:Domain of unknown function (DUF6907)
VTSDQTPRQNHDGHPCPDWCVTDHGKLRADGIIASHFGRTVTIDIPGRDNALDEVSVKPIAAQGLPSQVLLGSLRTGHDDPSPYLFATPGDAVALAAIVDMLAAATPDQHRELAAAIRKAAADIADGGQP